MPADEVTTGSGVDAARVRTGPRHAAPKKPLFTRLHMPAGKAIALAAMPTAVLMGMGFTPTLANAEDQPTSKSLTIDEYKDCVAALEDSEGADASASPSPSASASASESADDTKDDAEDDSGSGPKDEPTGGTSDSSGGTGGSGDSTSPDSGSGEEAEPAPAPSSEPQNAETSGDTATADPSPSETDKNLLETIGDTITDLFDGKDTEETATASPAPSASESASTGTGDDTATDTGSGSAGSGTGEDTSDPLTDAVKDTADKAGDTAKATGDKAEDKADDEADKAADAADATASPTPSESATTDVDDCPVATEDESGIDNKTPLPDDPWYLNASSLTLKGADYQGIVEVKTANGTKKKVLKYVISQGTDIGDLHQTVDDKQSGVTYHVQAGSGTTSTIRNGDTIMYTESISGNLFGLIPVTFDPENPPPLNIPLIYFTKVKVVQAGQFGGDLHIPGMHLYNTK